MTPPAPQKAFIAAIDLCASAGSGPAPPVAGAGCGARAVRQPLYSSENPLTRLGARSDYLTDLDWLHGFEHVADTGLVWDLLLYAEQLPSSR